MFAAPAAIADPAYRVNKDEYIVRFKSDITRDEALTLIRQMTAQHDLKLRHAFQNALVGFSAEIPAAKLAALQLHPSIATIQENGVWYLYAVDPPTNIVVNRVSDSRIDLTWTDNGTTERGTVIERNTNGGGYAQIDLLIGADIESYSDTSALAGVEHCYRIRVGESFAVVGDWSEPACEQSEPPGGETPPDAPTGLTTSAISTQRIDLSWSDNSDNENGFRIERAIGTSGAFAEIDVIAEDLTSYASTGLVADTEYCYRVRAYNAEGDSAYTNESCATTLPTTSSPLGAPSDLLAVENGSQVDLSWTDNATAEVGFEVQRSTTGPTGVFSRLAVFAGVDVEAYTDAAPAAGAENCYRVRAGRSLADLGDFSNVACVDLGGGPVELPAAPTALTATTVNSGRIDLTWLDNADNENGFRIERASSAAGPFTQIDVTGANVTSYASTNLSAETEYCYRVQAYNGAGDSAYTATMCATTDTAPSGCTDTGAHDSLADLWGISRVGADLNATWQASTQEGCGITPWFFSIDSGVDADHPDLNVAEVMGFIASEPGAIEDDNGHGTHTSGTAAAIDGNGGVVGVAPGAPVYGFKVCGSAGTCALDDIAAAVDEVTARKLANPNQPMVANMSLGGGGSEANDTAVRRSVNAGVVYSVAAGNGVLGACIFPADAATSSPARIGDDFINAANGSDGNGNPINGVITVTSSTQTNGDANCNFGAAVTVAAPGVDILSTTLNGGLGYSSGTSMAAPHAAGAAILYLMRFPDATPTEVEQAIVNELEPWFPTETPNASGQLAVEDL